MRNAAYLDTANKFARAAMSGTALPSINATLLSHLGITGIFFAGDEVITVDEGSAKCVIKPKAAPTSAPALIDATAEPAVVGAETHYVFEWASADSAELRTFLDAQADPSQPVEMRCEVEYTIDNEIGRIAFPIMMVTSYSRPEDPAPSAAANSSWEWLKERVEVDDGVAKSVDDTGKKITLSAPGIATNAAAIAAEVASRVAGDEACAEAINSEALTRAFADSVNASALGLEEGRRAAGDTTNATAISAEATTRAAADAALQVNITAEASTRATADTTNANAIAAEAAARASHAAQHKGSGGDAIKLDELAAPTDVTTLDATASAHGLMSKADKIKLNGIATGANAYVLPPAGDGVLGGVMRSVGVAGQYVNGINPNGTLIYGTPGGGGEGGRIVRGSVILQGNTDPGDPGGEANFGESRIIFDDWSDYYEGDINFSVNEGSAILTLSFTDPADPDRYWVDLSPGYDNQTVTAAVLAILTASFPYLNASPDGPTNIVIRASNPGSYYYADTSSSVNNINAQGLVHGDDGSEGYPPTGAVLEAAVLTPASGKSLVPLRIGVRWQDMSATMRVSLRNPATNEDLPLCDDFTLTGGAGSLELSDAYPGNLALIGEKYPNWINDTVGEWYIYATFVSTPNDGASVNVWAQAFEEVALA